MTKVAGRPKPRRRFGGAAAAKPGRCQRRAFKSRRATCVACKSWSKIKNNASPFCGKEATSRPLIARNRFWSCLNNAWRQRATCSLRSRTVAAWRSDVKPLQLSTPGRVAPDATHRRVWKARLTQARLLHSGLGGALAQLLSAKPTRAALAWSVASPLTPYPETEHELARCSATISFDAEPPSGSLGDACGAFRSINGLRPMKTSSGSASTPAQKLAIRRQLFHDSLHVLLDFKPDWPGQLGVFSFVAAQRYCPQFEWTARTLSQLYVTAAPWLREDLAHAEYRG